MSDDLDDFLRQAAERRAKRQQQKGGSSAPNAPTPSRPAPQPRPAPQSRPASPPPLSTPQSRESSQSRRPQPPLRPAPPVVEVVEDVRPTVGRLEPTIASRHVTSELEQADEHLQEHLQSAFDHEIGSVGKNKKGGKAKSSVQVSDASPTVSKDARTASVSSMDLRDQLRDPQTLRLAIIAHEILRRPYQ